jgi:PqqD family protein of HPr-rel-A system
MTLAKPTVRRDLTVVELDGEAVIYDEGTGELHHLNPTATIVFGLCDGTATMRELATDIADAFGVPRDEVESQVRAVVRRFRAAGLLEPSVPTPARAPIAGSTADA